MVRGSADHAVRGRGGQAPPPPASHRKRKGIQRGGHDPRWLQDRTAAEGNPNVIRARRNAASGRHGALADRQPFTGRGAVAPLRLHDQPEQFTEPVGNPTFDLIAEGPGDNPCLTLNAAVQDAARDNVLITNFGRDLDAEFLRRKSGERPEDKGKFWLSNLQFHADIECVKFEHPPDYKRLETSHALRTRYLTPAWRPGVDPGRRTFRFTSFRTLLHRRRRGRSARLRRCGWCRHRLP